ncbi:hypothetical protein C8R45DRAFT_1147862 [Mycena sanguinolenta]|nr:hypothetical protein C8R45DRAFT_1147862 [Mycena sanguinolenta]
MLKGSVRVAAVQASGEPLQCRRASTSSRADTVQAARVPRHDLFFHDDGNGNEDSLDAKVRDGNGDDSPARLPPRVLVAARRSVPLPDAFFDGTTAPPLPSPLLPTVSSLAPTIFLTLHPYIDARPRRCIMCSLFARVSVSFASGMSLLCAFLPLDVGTYERGVGAREQRGVCVYAEVTGEREAGVRQCAGAGAGRGQSSGADWGASAGALRLDEVLWTLSTSEQQKAALYVDVLMWGKRGDDDGVRTIKTVIAGARERWCVGMKGAGKTTGHQGQGSPAQVDLRTWMAEEVEREGMKRLNPPRSVTAVLQAFPPYRKRLDSTAVPLTTSLSRPRIWKTSTSPTTSPSYAWRIEVLPSTRHSSSTLTSMSLPVSTLTSTSAPRHARAPPSLRAAGPHCFMRDTQAEVVTPHQYSTSTSTSTSAHSPAGVIPTSGTTRRRHSSFVPRACAHRRADEASPSLRDAQALLPRLRTQLRRWFPDCRADASPEPDFLGARYSSSPTAHTRPFLYPPAPST